ELCRLAAELGRREMWRRLGFASEAHCCRERLGIGRSSLEEKQVLAARASRLPEVEAAAVNGIIAVTAALLLTRMATKKAATAWVEQARQRALKHLRQEVDFVRRALCKVPGHEDEPPRADVIAASLALNGELASGRAAP